MREWAWAGNTDFDILNVCSDKSVGKKTEDMDPADAPFPVTSEVEKITEFLKQPKPKVVFCTYQSSELIAEAQLDGSVPAFDLAIADEAHRCAGKADAGFATILDADKIRLSKRLFTTATPRYFGKAIKDEAKARDLAVVGMDNEAVFGPVIHKLTFGQAIEQELLTDYQVVIVGVDEPMVREWIENYEIVSTDPDNETDARTLAAKIGMLKAVKDYDLKRVISFHSRVAGAKQFSDELVDVANLIEPANRPEGTFLSDYVSGAMKAGDRKEKIDRLKELEGYDRGILTNARCLAEGVDVPSLDGVAFIDPRGSQVEIIQAVGRAIRKVRGAKVQKKGTIVLPVFIEDGDDHETSIDASNFKPVWDVLKALRAHDEVLADTLDEYRTNMAKNASQSRKSISNKIIFDMPVSVDAEFSSALRTVLVEASTASWEFWFGLLEEYTNEHGHAAPEANYLAKDGYKLGRWVVKQRTNSEMTTERKTSLNNLPGWVWKVRDAWWENGYRHLVEYENVHHSTDVKVDFVCPNGFKLGIWLRTQRTGWEKLDKERKQRLAKLPNWAESPSELKWLQGYHELLNYQKLNNELLVPRPFETDNGFKLGAWVQAQRISYQHGDLDDDLFQKLDQLDGWVWAPKSNRWALAISKLKQYRDRFGDTAVPDKHIEDGFALGRWCNTRRSRKAQLNESQIAELNDLSFIWNVLDYEWKKAFKALQSFRDREGHCLVRDKHIEGGINLGNWVKVQRRGRQDDDKIELLNSLGFVWNVLDWQWGQGYQSLKEFWDREKHCQVPAQHEENGFKLGVWVGTQRSAKVTMSPERKQRLDDIGFVWAVRKGKT